MNTSNIFSSNDSYSHNSTYTKESFKINYLEHRINKLYLITEALWLLIKEKYNLDDENLTELIVAIDMKDGRHDGKVAVKGTHNCPKCGKPNSRKHLYCIYCGTFLDIKPFE